jgi:hypothetical protein
MSDKASDYIPINTFKNIKFVNVEDDAMVKMVDPNPKWANLKDCGDFPCTAPKNTVYMFTGVSAEGDVQPKFEGKTEF